MRGFAPELMGGKVYNDDGIGGAHMYMPRFNHRDGRKRDYLRGFGCQFWYTGAQTDLSYAKSIPGFGLDFKKAVKERYPAVLALHPFGEAFPKAGQSYYRERLAAGSVRRAYIAHRLSAPAKTNAVWRTTCTTRCLEILHAAKAEILPFERGHLEPNGSAIHEHGTCRMGDRSEAFRSEWLLPDARGEECLRGRWFRIHNRFGEESDADDSCACLARHGFHGGRNTTRQHLNVLHKLPELLPLG